MTNKCNLRKNRQIFSSKARFSTVRDFVCKIEHLILFNVFCTSFDLRDNLYEVKIIIGHVFETDFVSGKVIISSSSSVCK